NRVRQVDAPVTRTHGNPELMLARDPIQHTSRQSARLGSKHECVTGPELHIAVYVQSTRLHGEYSYLAEALEACVQARMHTHLCELLIVQPRAAHSLAVNVKTQRSDQMQVLPELAHRRMTLPVFGAISGRNRMTWNMVRSFSSKDAARLLGHNAGHECR